MTKKVVLDPKEYIQSHHNKFNNDDLLDYMTQITNKNSFKNQFGVFNKNSKSSAFIKKFENIEEDNFDYYYDFEPVENVNDNLIDFESCDNFHKIVDKTKQDIMLSKKNFNESQNKKTFLSSSNSLKINSKIVNGNETQTTIKKSSYYDKITNTYVEETYKADDVGLMIKNSLPYQKHNNSMSMEIPNNKSILPKIINSSKGSHINPNNQMQINNHNQFQPNNIIKPM